MKHIQKSYPKTSTPCTCLNIRRASKAVVHFYDGVLKPEGITSAQIGLLKHMERFGVKTMNELAQIMRIDRTTLNRNLKPLISAGFVDTRQGQDSRTRYITLTEAGAQVLSRAWKLWEEAQSDLCEYLGETDLDRLNKMLAKIEALVP